MHLKAMGRLSNGTKQSDMIHTEKVGKTRSIDKQNHVSRPQTQATRKQEET